MNPAGVGFQGPRCAAAGGGSMLGNHVSLQFLTFVVDETIDFTPFHLRDGHGDLVVLAAFGVLIDIGRHYC
jgi:hypothetical protein